MTMGYTIDLGILEDHSLDQYWIQEDENLWFKPVRLDAIHSYYTGYWPATTEEFWANADIFILQHKVHVSIRLDDEIVNFFKQGGRGYQSKINAVLKAYVYAHTKTHRNKHAH